jgi:hypothetical protein
MYYNFYWLLRMQNLSQSDEFLLTIGEGSGRRAFVERVQEPMYENQKSVPDLKSCFPKGSFVSNF